MISFSAKNLVYKALLVALGVLLIGVMAQVEIEVSGQSYVLSDLAVLLVALFLPFPVGLITIFCYLILGGLGLPIFADAQSGWKVFSSGSGGYLLGFAIAGVAINANNTSGKSWKIAQLIYTGMLVILLSGSLWLKLGIGLSWEDAYLVGFKPFILSAMLKSAVAWLTWLVVERLFKKRKQTVNFKNRQ